MNKIVLAIAPLLLASAPVLARETRCGWLHNPTPGNWWLVDRHGLWVINTQGGAQAAGLDLVKFYEGELARRNFVSLHPQSGYGYLCACMRVTTNKNSNPKRITRIWSGEQVPLQQCRQDPALPRG
ncbi:MAG: DUF4087 domain-containing protein [Pseudanabaenaceae cyanobacterium]